MAFIVFTYRLAMSCLHNLSISVSVNVTVKPFVGHVKFMKISLKQLFSWFEGDPYCLLIYNIRPRASCHSLSI